MIVLPTGRHHASHAPAGRLARLPAPLARLVSRAADLPRAKKIRLGVAAVMLYTLLAGDRGLVRLAGLLYGRAAIRAELRGLDGRRAALEGDLRSFTRDPGVVERVAREQLDLVRPGETVYKFPAR